MAVTLIDLKVDEKSPQRERYVSFYIFIRYKTTCLFRRLLKGGRIYCYQHGIVMKERSKRLSAMNVYISNLPAEEVPTGHIHDLYSLRWQIELLFKTWKAFFKIDHCNEIKRERLECHLYGQLIGILLCASTMFQMRQLLLDKKKGN